MAAREFLPSGAKVRGTAPPTGNTYPSSVHRLNKKNKILNANTLQCRRQNSKFSPLKCRPVQKCHPGPPSSPPSRCHCMQYVYYSVIACTETVCIRSLRSILMSSHQLLLHHLLETRRHYHVPPSSLRYPLELGDYYPDPITQRQTILGFLTDVIQLVF